MQKQVDVVVVGGGTAGVVAAIQAGRAGAKVLLVEKNGMLGGTMTVGGINAPAHFCAWGKQIIAGIGWELMCKTWKETGQPIPTPDYTRDRNKPGHLTMDRTVFAAVCDDAVLAAGVELLFHAMPAEITRTPEGWDLRLCTKTGLTGTRAKVLIDATGDANAVALAGFERVHPDIIQPATLNMHCSGYNPAELDFAALDAAAQKAIAAGVLQVTDIGWGNDGSGPFLRRYGLNANHVRAPGAETSEGKSLAEVEGRRAMLRMYRFFRRQSGLENFRIDWICSETAIRETVTIRGKRTLLLSDYLAGRLYEDAVCYAFYPIDAHLHDGKGIDQRSLARHVLPTISRGAMLPAGSSSLIVAGRCIASDHETNSAIRVQCPCMGMGQAAGAMAALSSRTGCDPELLPMADIHAMLRDHGAVIPGDIRFNEDKG